MKKEDDSQTIKNKLQYIEMCEDELKSKNEH